MKPHWVLNPKPDTAEALARQVGLPAAIISILFRRGISQPAEIQKFLNPTLEQLESPFVFRDMTKAVKRIRAAISSKEKILIYGDYDVDGITGSAILYPVLQKLGAAVDVHIPNRLTEGYGLNQDTLTALIKKKYKLVITVDNGISGVSQIAFLKEKGIDTIIIDHHLPKDVFPDAYAIVSGCVGGKGDDGLAACGLAFKTAWALTGSLDEVKEHLDLVTVGTIADVAKVTGENRILLKFGLPILLKTKKVGLRALMDVAKIPRHMITFRDIAFGLGPRINASGRMGSPENAFRILTTDNALLAQNLANILDEGNKDRQRVELAAFEQAIERVEFERLKETEKILVLESPEWHVGVLGIVASRLVERYQRPAVVISMRGGVGKGSGRSFGEFSLFEIMNQCEEFFDAFGGHAQACGLTIQSKNIAGFRKKLNELAAKHEELFRSAKKLDIDAELTLSDITPAFLTALDKLAPFGPGNAKPLFVSKELSVRGEAKKRGQDALQAWVTDAQGKTTCEAFGFRAYEKWRSNPKKRFDLVYEPELKDFNGITSIQLTMEDWD